MIRDLSHLEALTSLSCAFFLLTQLGLLVSYKKSYLITSQMVEFIGAKIDSIIVKGYLPQDRFLALLIISEHCDFTPSGNVTDLSYVIRPYVSVYILLSSLHLWPLQFWLRFGVLSCSASD